MSLLDDLSIETQFYAAMHELALRPDAAESDEARKVRETLDNLSSGDDRAPLVDHHLGPELGPRRRHDRGARHR